MAALRRGSIGIPVALGIALALYGLLGRLTAAWGYGLLLLSFVLLAVGVLAFAVFCLTRWFDDAALRVASVWLCVSGIWTYVWGVAALAGYFVHAALDGSVEIRWMIFGPAAILALGVLDFGLYRVLVKRNLPTWQRYRQYVSRADADPAAMRRTLVDDVIVQRALLSAGAVRWLRHALIFWGFVLMFGTELVAVFVREGLPAFGYPDVWEIETHPVRLAFDFAYDLFGAMVLAGCGLALWFRMKVEGTDLQKFTDTPTTLFLLFVVVSGFVIEGMRIAGSDPGPHHYYSFVGVVFAAVIPGTVEWPETLVFEFLWLVHVLGSCAFIAYVPLRRMVHTCATPMGRLMGSQRGLLEAKRRGVLGALMVKPPG